MRSLLRVADLVARIGPILLFLVFATVLAELCAGLGLFDLVADAVVHVAHGSVRRVWAGLVAVAVASTALLSLDTTAVLLTPVVLAVAVRLRINPVLFAMTTVLLANTASLFLPVSNLTNLLALSHLDLSVAEYAALMALPGLVAVLVTVAVLHRRTLGLPRREYDEPAPLEGPRTPVVVAALACVALGPALTIAGRVTVVSGLACGAVVLACLVWRRDLLHLRLVPWLLVLAVGLLFFLVQLAHEHGLGELAGRLTGTGEGPLALLRLAWVAAGAANVLDNLPAYLALEPVTEGSPERLGALLVGVGVGPLVTPWASLATLLWAQRCHAAGLAIHWGRFALTGVLVAVPAVTLATLTLSAVTAGG